MKKIICSLLLGQAAMLSSHEIDKKKEIIDTILQIDNYSIHAEQLIKSMGSSLTTEEFAEKFLNKYSQADFQDSLKEALDKKFTSEQIEEIHHLITSDLYKKYSKELTAFIMQISPQITQLFLSIFQEPQAQPVLDSSSKAQENHIIVADEANFQSIVDQYESVIVDIYASWCSPCKALSPILEDLSNEFNKKCAFVKIDADTNHNLVNKLNARGLPTLLFYKNGKEVHRKTGFIDKEKIVKLIKSFFEEVKTEN